MGNCFYFAELCLLINVIIIYEIYAPAQHEY